MAFNAEFTAMGSGFVDPSRRRRFPCCVNQTAIKSNEVTPSQMSLRHCLVEPVAKPNASIAGKGDFADPQVAARRADEQ